tara:strand:- start:35 stop:442 length:408 start_codon:yes stop_codon:yes gene_type:complete
MTSQTGHNFEKEFQNAKKKNFFKKVDEYKQKMERGKQFLKDERYLIKIKVEGCPFCGHDSMIEPKEIITTVTLEDLPQTLKYCSEPFWEHPSVNWQNHTDEEFCDNVPFEEKKWGIYKSVQILKKLEVKKLKKFP